MDTSKEYIKMCDCEEIQKQHYLLSDEELYAYPIHSHPDNTIYLHCQRSLGHKERLEVIWLPRQDQLQSMFKLCSFSLLMKFCRAYNLQEPYCSSDHNVVFFDAWSIEALWLMFFMKEKHNKIWNGKEWTNDT